MNRTRLLFFLCAPLLLLQANTQEEEAPQGPHCVVKHVSYVGEIELILMTMDEFQERHKIIRQEQHVLDLAVRAAIKDWMQETDYSFPRIFAKPQLVRLSVDAKQKKALLKLKQFQEAEAERQAIRERNEENAEDRYNGRYNQNAPDKAELRREKKQELINKAKSIVRDKMDEMMGDLKTPHMGRLKPEDVIPTARP